ncbi:cache domain-containing protein [Candidatus Fermentibacteria bacterium]|nr:cache domain-containing protein [Candidatus Fermentibacteria bacterium]
MVFFLVLVAGFGCGTPSPALDAQRLLSAFVSYTDLRISSVQRSVRILASTSEAKSGDWEKMKDLLAGYQETEEGLIVWYVHPDGTYYTVDKGLMDVTLSDRSYFPDLMASKVVTGEVVVSKSTAQRSAIIAAPVKNGDVVVGAVGASLFLDKLSEEINTMLALGPDASFFALAPNALTALHRHTDRHFLDPRDLGSESLKAAVERMLSDTSGEVTYEFDNRMKRATYHTSPLTQWRFAIAM